MNDYDHLRGLVRRSPCCIDLIYHTKPMYEPYPDCIEIACKKCGKVIKGDFLLFNYKEEMVWPPPKAAVDRQPHPKKRKRCRRTIPIDPDPEPYRILWP